MAQKPLLMVAISAAVSAAVLLMAPMLLMRSSAARTPVRPRLPVSVQTADGRVLQLAADHARGELVVVTLKAAGCPVCREQLTRLRRSRHLLAACGAQVVVVTPDPPEVVASLIRDLQLPFDIVSDPLGLVATALGLRDDARAFTMPAVLLFDRQRELRWLHVGRRPGLFVEGQLIRRLDCSETRI